MDISEALNADFIDTQYRRWQDDPTSVARDWQFFFQGFAMGSAGPPEAEAARRLSRVETLIHRYRDLGHLLACMDPLAACPTEHPLLAIETIGLTPADLQRSFPGQRLGLPAEAPLARHRAGPQRKHIAAALGWSTCTCRTPMNANGCKSEWSRTATDPVSTTKRATADPRAALPFGRLRAVSQQEVRGRHAVFP